MIKTILSVSTLLSLSAFGAFTGPRLIYSMGGQGMGDNQGVTKSCHVYMTHSEIKGKEDEVAKKIDEASKKAFKTTGQHIRKQVPSIEYFALKLEDSKLGPATKPSKVSLYLDSSDIKTREGNEAKELIDLINKACGIK